MATLGLLQAALPAPAHVAGPPGGGEEVEYVGAAQQADHLAALDHRHPAYSLADQDPRGLVDSSVLADGDHVRAHDVARDLAFLGEHIALGHDADDVSVGAENGRG